MRLPLANVKTGTEEGARLGRRGLAEGAPPPQLQAFRPWGRQRHGQGRRDLPQPGNRIGILSPAPPLLDVVSSIIPRTHGPQTTSHRLQMHQGLLVIPCCNIWSCPPSRYRVSSAKVGSRLIITCLLDPVLTLSQRSTSDVRPPRLPLPEEPATLFLPCAPSPVSRVGLCLSDRIASLLQVMNKSRHAAGA